MNNRQLSFEQNNFINIYFVIYIFNRYIRPYYGLINKIKYIYVDGVHLPRPYINNLWGLNVCLNIHPNCPPIQDKTVTNKTIINGGGELIQSGNDLLIDHLSIQSGGRAVLRADHAIIISSDFEVARGGEVLMICKPCTN